MDDIPKKTAPIVFLEYFTVIYKISTFLTLKEITICWHKLMPYC